MPDSQPLRITLPPLQITLTENQQIDLQWLAQNQLQSAEATQQGLSNSWKQWIAENKLHDNSDDSIIQAMLKNGIDFQVAIQEVNRIAADPSFLAGR
ncbi:MAG TPA: hypothetical protein V6D26_15145, partial [Stenomitos sp.]